MKNIILTLLGLVVLLAPASASADMWDPDEDGFRGYDDKCPGEDPALRLADRDSYGCLQPFEERFVDALKRGDDPALQGPVPADVDWSRVEARLRDTRKRVRYIGGSVVAFRVLPRCLAFEGKKPKNTCETGYLYSGRANKSLGLRDGPSFVVKQKLLPVSAGKTAVKKTVVETGLNQESKDLLAKGSADAGRAEAARKGAEGAAGNSATSAAKARGYANSAKGHDASAEQAAADAEAAANRAQRIANSIPRWEMAAAVGIDTYRVLTSNGKLPVYGDYTVSIRPQAVVTVQPIGFQLRLGRVVLRTGLHGAVGFGQRLGQGTLAMSFGAGGDLSILAVLVDRQLTFALGGVVSAGGDARNVIGTERAEHNSDTVLLMPTGRVGGGIEARLSQGPLGVFARATVDGRWSTMPNGDVATGPSVSGTLGFTWTPGN